VAARLAARASRGGILAVNLGANKDSADKAADYVAGVERLGRFASFLTINVSSPNTPGLRDLQLPETLSKLLQLLAGARERLAAQTGARPPMIVKLSPEIAEDDLSEITQRLLAGGADGIAICNTTLARDGLTETIVGLETGGLSGRPLFRRSTRMLARIFQLSQGKVPLIGIGGIDSGEAAAAKIAAGASLVQVYTGLIFEGPGLPARITRHLASELERRKLSSIGALRGLEAERWSRATP
jgi:dihydroorotate dehydrogenase